MKTLPYRIQSDGTFWQIAKLRIGEPDSKNAGKDLWKIIKYPSTLKGAAETVRELLLADALYTPEAQLDVEAILNAIKASDKTLEAIMREVASKSEATI